MRDAPDRPKKKNDLIVRRFFKKAMKEDPELRKTLSLADPWLRIAASELMLDIVSSYRAAWTSRLSCRRFKHRRSSCTEVATFFLSRRAASSRGRFLAPGSSSYRATTTPFGPGISSPCSVRLSSF
jgi:hypothetical protein